VSKSKSKKRNETGARRRLTPATVVLAILILAIGAITVVSRQRAAETATGGKVQMAEKDNFTEPKVASQDSSLTAEPQELTAAEAQKLAAGMKELVNQSTDGLVEVKHEDGSVSVDLQGRFQNVTVARINKDGSVSQSCVDNPRAAGAFFGIDPKLIDSNSNSTGAKPAKTTSKTRN
jgi:hypothetical protein